MTKSEAEEIVERYLNSEERGGTPDLVLLKDVTIEREFGWIFFYQSKRFLETGNISDILAGNAPLVVTKSDGRLHVTGTAHPIEHYLERFVGYKR
jgi:hypothetical protein